MSLQKTINQVCQMLLEGQVRQALVNSVEATGDLDVSGEVGLQAGMKAQPWRM